MHRLARSIAASGILLFATAGCEDAASGPVVAPIASALGTALAPGQVIEIGSLGAQTFPLDLNDKGMVVGTTYAGGAARAFRWTVEGGIELLETPDGWNSGARAVNRHGEVVGGVSDGGTSRPAIWSAAGELRELPSPPAPFDWASPLAINDPGMVGGLLVDVDAEDPDEYALPFRWTDRGGYELAEYPFGLEPRWGGLNDRGDIVGSADPLMAEQFGIYLDRMHGGMLEIGSMSGIWTYATDLNNDGLVVGYDWAPGIVERPFAWTAGDGFRLLDGFTGTGQPNRVNDRGEIVGFASDDDGLTQYAFFWSEERGVADLGLEAGLSAAYAINKHGHVAGVRASDGAAVLWTGFDPGGSATPAAHARFRGVSRATAATRLPCGLEGDPASRADLLRCALRPY